MEDSPGASEKRCGLVGGNGMIMSEQGRLCDPAGCSKNPSGKAAADESAVEERTPLADFSASC
jgi:hypothetical protein